MRKKYYSLEKNDKQAEVMIYGDVTSFPWLESDVSAYNLSKQIQELEVDEITVGINSYGGEVAEGLAIYNALKQHKAKVTTRVDGFACSIASVIFAAGDNRVMNDSSLLMIHNAWTGACGDAKELRKAADDLDKINDASVKAYLSVTSVEEDELRAIMDEETWLSPEEAKEMGLATAVLKDETDKPSQNVRRKVFQMLKNPYMAEDEEIQTEDPENEETTPENAPEQPETPETEEESPENGEETPETDENEPESAENGEETGENDENSDENEPELTERDEENARQYAFFKAIAAL